MVELHAGWVYDEYHVITPDFPLKPRLQSQFRSKKRQLLRVQVMERDGMNCWLCGDGPLSIYGEPFATLDHIIPKSKGGTYVLSNLKIAHAHCNSKRGAP